MHIAVYWVHDLVNNNQQQKKKKKNQEIILLCNVQWSQRLQNKSIYYGSDIYTKWNKIKKTKQLKGKIS